MHGGGAGIAERERRAAKPVFAEGDALRTFRRGAQRMKMLERGVGLVEEPERDPAGEEVRLDIGVARNEPVLGGDVIGDARLTGVQRDAAIEAPLLPPSVEIDELLGSLGASSSIFQASLVARSLRRSHWMRL